MEWDFVRSIHVGCVADGNVLSFSLQSIKTGTLCMVMQLCSKILDLA
jgi:hypothetical protein